MTPSMLANPPSGLASWRLDRVYTPHVEPACHSASYQGSAHAATTNFELHFDQTVNQSSDGFKPDSHGAASQPTYDSTSESKSHNCDAAKRDQPSAHSELRFQAVADHDSHFEPQDHSEEMQDGKDEEASWGAQSEIASHTVAPAQDSSPWQRRSSDRRVAAAQQWQAAAGAGGPGESPKPSTSERKPSFWTKDEHEHFLIGLQKFANRTPDDGTSQHPLVGLGPGVAEQISDFLGTRSAAQVRSHAQKHFLRQWKDKTAK